MLVNKKQIEAIRLLGFIAIGGYMAFTGNIVIGFAAALIAGFIDQFVVKRYLKSKENK